VEAADLPFFIRADDAPGKQRILRGALRLFAQQGLDGTSIRDIATAAGITNPALYRHFATKDALALHLFIVCYRELWGQLRLAAARRQGFQAQLEALVDAFLAYHDACPDAVLYVAETIHRFWPRVPPPMETQSVTLLARALIEQGVAEGAVRAGVATPVRVLGVVGQLFQLARMIHLRLIEGPAGRWRDDVQRQLRQMLQ
jgi:AcrR family transcriptional regulator